MDFSDLLIDAGREMFAPTTAAFALAAIGLNFHFGMTGLLNMGHAGFMLLGMYGYAITIREIEANDGMFLGIEMAAGAQIALGVLVSILVAVAFGLLLGWPTLKLRGDYLAIVTIAAAEMVRFVGRSQSLKGLTGASTGIRGKDYKRPFESLSPFPDRQVELGPFTLHGSQSTSWWLVLVAWSVVFLAALLFWRLSRSPWGRVLKGIREDEDAVRSLGKNVYAYKMQALVLGGVIGTFGGMIIAVGADNVQPDNFSRDLTFYVLTGLVLGGVAKVTGSIVGPMLFWALYAFLDSFLRQLVGNKPVRIGNTTIISSVQVGPVVYMMMGALLVALMVYRPQGLFGNRKEMAFDAH